MLFSKAEMTPLLLLFRACVLVWHGFAICFILSIYILRGELTTYDGTMYQGIDMSHVSSAPSPLRHRGVGFLSCPVIPLYDDELVSRHIDQSRQ